MSESSNEPPVTDLARPPARQSPGTRAHAWLVWFGPVRLVATALSVVLVAIAGYWLVRAPAPPAEATLPLTTDATTLVSSTTIAAQRSWVGVDGPEPTSTVPHEIVVHVAGQVNEPGVYSLGAERRVHDAIDAAGGPTLAADTELLNLAQVLHDGQRVYVPGDGDEPGVDLVTPTGGAAAVATSVPAGPVDVNRADVEQLDSLPGIGPSTARAIVDERTRNGPFTSVDDLERVPGIGPAKLGALREFVVV